MKCSKLSHKVRASIHHGGLDKRELQRRTVQTGSRRKDANCASPDLHVLSADLRSSVLLNTETRCPPPPLAAASRIRPRRCGIVRSADIAARGVTQFMEGVSGLPPLGTNPSAHGSSIWAVEVQGRRALHVHLLPSSIIYAVVQSQQSG